MIDPPDVAATFAAEWPRLVATLVRDIGDVGLAEDAAQDAFLEAARHWARTGPPDRPAAWLLTTARRKAIDQIRRSNRFEERLPALLAKEELQHADSDGEPSDRQLIDDQVALMLGCCHPALDPDAQVALTLRVVAGLSTAQIARAFFVSESAMTRRLTRSKTKIRAANIPFTKSDLETLHDRLPAMCSVIYSIFTEGHASASAPTLLRGDLCDEAVWLAGLLHELVPGEPEVAGLAALLLLIDARRTTRVDAHGAPILLADQQRSLWDQALIGRGLALLAKAHARRRGGPYQLQAAIAALHATAPSFQATDWSSIVDLYDVLLRRQPTALVAMNRAIAVAQRDGPEVGLRALDMISAADDLDGDVQRYPYFHSARAELLWQLDEKVLSSAAFDEAIRFCTNDAEAHLLAQRQRELQTTS